MRLKVLSMPFQVGWDIVHQCNLRCRHCYLDQQQLSDTMIRYWTRFAKTGSPNGRSAPAWPAYNPGTDQVQSLVPPTPFAESTFDTEHKCSVFWNTF